MWLSSSPQRKLYKTPQCQPRINKKRIRSRALCNLELLALIMKSPLVIPIGSSSYNRIFKKLEHLYACEGCLYISFRQNYFIEQTWRILHFNKKKSKFFLTALPVIVSCFDRAHAENRAELSAFLWNICCNEVKHN